MKLWLFLLLLVWSIPIQADELLLNSKFTLGNSHWDGDAEKVALTDSDNENPLDQTAASSAPPVLVLKLKNSEWTKVSQDFSSPPGNVLLTVVYIVSNDFQLSNHRNDYENLPGSIGATFWWAFPTPVGNWVAMLGDVGARHEEYKEILPPTVNPTTPQTFLHRFSTESNGQKTLYLTFPPGTGTITFKQISLSPDRS